MHPLRADARTRPVFAATAWWRLPSRRLAANLLLSLGVEEEVLAFGPVHISLESWRTVRGRRQSSLTTYEAHAAVTASHLVLVDEAPNHTGVHELAASRWEDRGRIKFQSDGTTVWLRPTEDVRRELARRKQALAGQARGPASGRITQVSRANPIASWQDAEHFAADWMRVNGFGDATTTQSGADGGVDVVSRWAVAQVKFQQSKVGRPALQQLVAAAADRDASPIFLARNGYSAQAIEYAHGRVWLLSCGSNGHVWETCPPPPSITEHLPTSGRGNHAVLQRPVPKRR